MGGWIKLHRKIRSNPIFNDLQLFRLWTICLLEASHKPHEQPVGRQVVNLEAGQFVTGRFDLHGMYNQGLKKNDHVAEYTVWRWLQTLEKHGMVSINSSNKYSIITVLNWSLYQIDEQQNEHEDEQQMSNKRATNEQQMSTNKNVKNEKNEKNEKKEKTYSPEFEKFWFIYPRRVGKKEAFDVWARLLKKVDVGLIIRCTENYAAHCKNNVESERYILHPKTFLQPDKERFMDYQEMPVVNVGRGNGKPVGSSDKIAQWAKELEDEQRGR